MSKVLNIAFLLVHLTNASQLTRIIKSTPIKGRIIGGDEVEPHSLPYQVGLLINKNAFCGGALITPSFVVTAGHCGMGLFKGSGLLHFLTKVRSSITAILGAHNHTLIELSQQRINGVKVIIHNDYDDDTLLNDISLIQLQKSAEINEFVQLVKLPSVLDANKTYINEIAKASGWGLPHDVRFPTMSDMSDVLLAVDVKVSDLEDCKTVYNDNPDSPYQVSDTSICTSGYQNKGTCSGDSGGPLVINGILIGLTSFGTDDCEWCAPSVYAKVSAYVDWILINLK